MLNHISWNMHLLDEAWKSSEPTDTEQSDWREFIIEAIGQFDDFMEYFPY